MATDIRLIASGTTYYLSNSSGSPVAGGAATAAATTPFALLNDGWTMQAAVPDAVYQGGPPFRNGSTLAYQAYPNTTQAISISVSGSSHNNAVSLFQGLRQLINQTLYAAPCVLYYQPNTATNPLYFEVLSGSLQERTDPTNPTRGFAYLEADLTLTLSPFGGVASLTTLFTNTTFTNNGTSNTASLGTLAGDLPYEGQPLNLKVDGPSASTTDVGKLWLAVANSHVKTTHTTAISTSSTTSTPIGGSSIDCTPLLANAGLQLAVFLRMSSVTAGNKALFALQLSLTAGGGLITPVTAWQPLPVTSGTTMVYAGTFNLTGQRLPNATSLLVTYNIFLQSIDGTAVAYTVDYSDSVFVYTVAESTAQAATYGNSTGILYTVGAQNLNGTAWFPMAPPRAYTALSGGVNANFTETVRGVAPRAFPSALLWAAWIKAAGAHTTTDTLRITASHLPLFFTMRGAG